MKIYLDQLHQTDKIAYFKFIEDWKLAEEKIIPESADAKNLCFEHFLKDLENESSHLKTLFLRYDDKIIGAVELNNDVNLSSNDRLTYGICPSMRNQGYEQKIVQLGLDQLTKKAI